MSKLLKRALKLAFTPAVIIIAGKFLSLFILLRIYNIDFIISNDISGIFSIRILLEDSDMSAYVNSISSFITYLLITIPTLYLLLKHTVLKKAQSNPKTIVKLTRINVLTWLTKQGSSFLTTFVWTAFQWILSAMIVVQAISDNTYMWMGILAGVSAILFAWGILRTFELETAKIYPRDNKGYI
jgi:hypothetical protein